MSSRIQNLRRRDWTLDAPAAQAELSAALNPSGGQLLRPIQAAALREALQLDGLWLAARVGAGKTLVAALLATLYEDLRPLIVVPGGHSDKTELEFAGYRAAGWQLSHKMQVVTYSDLSRDVDERLLRGYHPGALILDEADKLRRVGRNGSATAKRIAQWMAAHPSTFMFAMSGTFFKAGLTDYAHLLNWTLKQGAPVPELPNRIAAWHHALKEGKAPKSVWAELGTEEADFRRTYRERLWSTPGVIISVDVFDGVPLTLSKVELDGSRELDALYTSGVTPAGFDVVQTDSDDAESIDGTWAVERQMALGFYYKPDPDPPEDWKKARRAYFRLVRKTIESGICNTELQARRRLAAAQHPTWTAWEAIQPTFTPRFVPVWLNDRALDYCKEWGEGGGVIWTDHRAFAARLSQETGWRWFAGGGLDQSGLMIEKCQDRTVIASRQANSTGRNLHRYCGPNGEGWHRGLVTAWPGNGRDAEQLLGRKHRDGQLYPVHMDIFTACRAHRSDITKVIDLSEQEQEEMGRCNKVLAATWV